MNDHLRATGRTQRLIEKAIHRAIEGRAVYLLTHTDNFAKLLQKRVDETWEKQYGKRPHGIKCETPPMNFRWDTLQLQNARANCICLLDHALVEERITRIQREIDQLVQERARLYPLTT